MASLVSGRYVARFIHLVRAGFVPQDGIVDYDGWAPAVPTTQYA